MSDRDEVDTDESAESAGSGKRLLAFFALSTVFLALSLATPAREWFHVDRIERLAEAMGVWGPVAIAALAILSPLLFLPRWPIAVVCGLLYGAVWGTALANGASTLGALLHYFLARGMLAPTARRLIARRQWAVQALPPQHAFLALFFLRAFPLSNFVATNLIAGALRIPWGTYVAASFLGMIPSTLMYAAWGKTLKRPEAGFYAVALVSLLFIAAGTLAARRRFGPWLQRLREPPAGGQAAPARDRPEGKDGA